MSEEEEVVVDEVEVDVEAEGEEGEEITDLSNR